MDFLVLFCICGLCCTAGTVGVSASVDDIGLRVVVVDDLDEEHYLILDDAIKPSLVDIEHFLK